MNPRTGRYVIKDGEQARVEGLISEALEQYAREWREGDDINGGDLVEWFGGWRDRLLESVAFVRRSK